MPRPRIEDKSETALRHPPAGPARELRRHAARAQAAGEALKEYRRRRAASPTLPRRYGEDGRVSRGTRPREAHFSRLSKMADPAVPGESKPAGHLAATDEEISLRL